MRTRALTLREALLVLKTARPGAAPNLGFFTQLQQFEQTLLKAGILQDEDVQLARKLLPLEASLMMVKPLGLLPSFGKQDDQEQQDDPGSADGSESREHKNASGLAASQKRRPGSLSLREYAELLDASKPPRVTLSKLALWHRRGFGLAPAEPGGTVPAPIRMARPAIQPPQVPAYSSSRHPLQKDAP